MVTPAEREPWAGRARARRAAIALAFLLPALAAASCGSAGSAARGLGTRSSPDGAVAETAPEAAGEPERPFDEREIAEYLRENPDDPSRAALELLLPAPVSAEEPERNGDYRRRDDRRSAGAVCRITQATISRSGAENSDGYIAAGAGGWKALFRARRTESGARAVSWYLAGEALAGGVRLHAGALAPDFALGLVFGGSGGASLSSGAFPFQTPRMIAGTTSFSARPLQGGAAEIRGRYAYAAAFCGRQVTYGPGGPGPAGTAAGARIEARRGRAGAGLSVSGGSPERGPRVLGIDGRWSSDGMNAGFEAAWRDDREPALLSAFSCRTSKTRAGLLLYFVPPGAGGAFGSVIGRSPGMISSIGGGAAVIERAIRRGIRVSASLDRYERADASHMAARRTARVECERRGRAGFLRLVWTGATEERLNGIPYPSASEIRSSGSRAFTVQGEWRIAACARVGAALKRIDEEGEVAWLIAPVLRANLLSDRFRMTVSFADYEAPFGNPVCYFYEPSLQGSFPLRVVSRDTRRGSMLIGLYINKLSVIAHVELEAGAAPDFSLQAAARL
jgi:hypothetical protein